MRNKHFKLNQNGFHVIELAIVVVVIAAIVGVGFFVLSRSKKENRADDRGVNTQQPANSESSGGSDSSQATVSWEFDGNKWQSSGTPPSCPDPLVFGTSPTDVSKAVSILYPGQSRGGNYKPHGGFRFGSSTNNIKVVAPMDAQLVEGSRYIEQGEVQYMLRFTNSCGISYRFDHLLKLSSTMQEQANKLPEPKENDSRTTNFDSPISVKEGDTVATAVGFAKASPKNVSFDLGVYDLRKLNAAASRQAYMSQHKDFLSQAGFAVCWFDMLPSKDAKIVKALPAGDASSGKTSDYCK